MKRLIILLLLASCKPPETPIAQVCDSLSKVRSSLEASSLQIRAEIQDEAEKAWMTCNELEGEARKACRLAAAKKVLDSHRNLYGALEELSQAYQSTALIFQSLEICR